MKRETSDRFLLLETKIDDLTGRVSLLEGSIEDMEMAIRRLRMEVGMLSGRLEAEITIRNEEHKAKLPEKNKEWGPLPMHYYVGSPNYTLLPNAPATPYMPTPHGHTVTCDNSTILPMKGFAGSYPTPDTMAGSGAGSMSGHQPTVEKFTFPVGAKPQ